MRFSEIHMVFLGTVKPIRTKFAPMTSCYLNMHNYYRRDIFISLGIQITLCCCFYALFLRVGCDA